MALLKSKFCILLTFVSLWAVVCAIPTQSAQLEGTHLTRRSPMFKSLCKKKPTYEKLEKSSSSNDILEKAVRRKIYMDENGNDPYEGINRTDAEIREDTNFEIKNVDNPWVMLGAQRKLRAKLRRKIEKVKKELESSKVILDKVDSADKSRNVAYEADVLIFGRDELPPQNMYEEPVELYGLRSHIEKARKNIAIRETQIWTREEYNLLEHDDWNHRNEAEKSLKELRDFYETNSVIVRSYTKELGSGEAIFLDNSDWC